MLHLHVCHFPFFDGYLKYWKNLKSMETAAPAEPGGRGKMNRRRRKKKKKKKKKRKRKKKKKKRRRRRSWAQR